MCSSHRTSFTITHFLLQLHQQQVCNEEFEQLQEQRNSRLTATDSNENSATIIATCARDELESAPQDLIIPEQVRSHQCIPCSSQSLSCETWRLLGKFQLTVHYLHSTFAKRIKSMAALSLYGSPGQSIQFTILLSQRLLASDALCRDTRIWSFKWTLASSRSMLGLIILSLWPSCDLPVQTSNEGIVIGSLDVHAIRALPGEVLIGGRLEKLCVLLRWCQS